MPDALIIALFGYPGALAALLLSAIGIARKSLALCFLGALLAIPFSFYLSANPGVGPIALLIPIFQIGSAWIVRRGGPFWLAWVLLLPLLLTSIWVLILVLRLG
jgi:hypothetical protein